MLVLARKFSATCVPSAMASCYVAAPSDLWLEQRTTCARQILRSKFRTVQQVQDRVAMWAVF